MQNDRGNYVKIGPDNPLTPDPCVDAMFLVPRNPFVLKPGWLREMLNECAEASPALGSLEGLGKGLSTEHEMDESAARSPCSRVGVDGAILSAIESPLGGRCRPPAVTTAREEVPRGDRLPTARDIAEDPGLEPDGVVIEGPIFRRLGDADMTGAPPRLRVLAHASPEDKHLLVQRLKSLGETVAVIGSDGGEDDVPAFGSTGDGFSVGEAGTAVAEEATLMDDSFSSVLTAVWTFLELLPHLTPAALSYVLTVGSGDARRMLIAFLVWSCICTEYGMSVLVSYCDLISRIMGSVASVCLRGLVTPRRRRMLKSEKRLLRSRFLKTRFSRDLRAGNRTPLADCLGQLGIDVSWGASNWLGHRYHVNTLGTWNLPGAQPYNNDNNNNRVGHVLAWDQSALLNNIGLCCCCAGVGVVKMLPRSPRRLSLMAAVALLLVVTPVTAAAAWTRAQTALALNVSVGAVAGTSAITVAVLRTKAQDLEPKWWIAAYSCWAVAFVVAVVGALRRPAVVGRRKVFLCATLLLTANLNGCLGGKGSSAVDSILTLGPALLVVSLYLMTVLIDVWPDVIRATSGA